MSTSHYEIRAPGNHSLPPMLFPPFLALALLGFSVLAATTKAAAWSEVASDSEGITGFDIFAYETSGSFVTSSFAVTGLHWWKGDPRCPGVEFPHNATVRLRASTRSATRNLANHCTVLEDNPYANAVRDEAYLYLFSSSRLRRKPVNYPSEFGGFEALTPDAVLTDERGTVLDSFGGFLYWGQYQASANWVILYRMEPLPGKAPDARSIIFSAGAPVQKLKAFSYVNSFGGTVEAVAVLLANGNLHECNVTAGRTDLLATGVNDFAIHTRSGSVGFVTSIYATRGLSRIDSVPPASVPGTLMRINADTLAATTIYTAPNHNQLISVAADSDQFVPFGGGGAVRKNIYITETIVATDGRVSDVLVKRHTVAVTTGDWDSIVITGAGGNLHSDDKWVYFLNQPAASIRKISSDAPAIKLDMQADALEVVQASQDLNQSVRLVALKRTFVRGYAHLALNDSSQPTFFPKATLSGYRGPTSLGSLSPLNSGIVTTDGNLDTLRSSRDTSFLFELPDTWVTEGDLTLQMTVDPDHIVPETVADPYANNSTPSSTVHFARGIHPCLVFIPLHTTAPPYDPSASGSGFGKILDRAASLLPVDRNGFICKKQSDPISKKVVVPKLCLCWPPVSLIEYRPFNLDEDDKSLALFWVGWRAFWSKNPTGFDSVHYIGTVHESQPASFNGIGNNPGESLVVRMQTHQNGGADGGGSQDPWALPWGGHILAHELGHNYGRNHINQNRSLFRSCGPTTPDGPYDDPDFDPCTLGPITGPGALFGFDSLTQTPIIPTSSGDLMTYATNRWISRYNWEILFPDRGGFAAASLAGRLPANLPGPVLFVHAKVDPAVNRAELSPGYCLPPGVADPQRVAESFAAAAQLPPDFPFKIRLLDLAGNVLSQTPCVLSGTADGGAITTLTLMQIVHFDPSTRLIQIVRDNVVLAEQLISGHAPTLALAPPVVDPINETLTLNWNAIDADNDYLLFTIQYSDDDGATWTALDADYPYLAMTVSTRSLPGSPVARVRVIATDGVNCAVAVSEPFAVARHAPELQIGGVREGQRLAFGALAELQGLVQDAEDLSRPTANLFWNLTGPTPRTGSGGQLSLTELSPGSYTADAFVSDFDNNAGSATRNFEILPLTIPDGLAPVLDGQSSDAGYANAAFVRVPLGGGEFARAWMFHAGSNLFVCFSDLQLPTTPGARRIVGLRVDANASRDPLGAAGDVGFFVDSDGIPFQEAGTGSAMSVSLSPQRGFTAVVQTGLTGWSAEFRIADSLLGGWGHAVGIMLDHDTPHWPPQAANNQPGTWALAYLGAPPPPDNRPPMARAGASRIINAATATTVVLDGSASSDPDGDPLSFAWTQVSGPPVLLIGPGTVSPSFLANSVNVSTTFRFRLVVSDASFTSGPDEMEVTVKPTPFQSLPDLPLSSQSRFVNGAFEFRMLGTPGAQYAIDASSNLVHWETIFMRTADSYGVMDFVDRNAVSLPARFYRLTPAPTNDYFASRIPLAGSFVTVSTANFLATKEPGEQNHAANAGGKSLWWSWTALASGNVTISTIGSGFDTLLAVYAGNSIAQLSPIAMDDDSGGNLTSSVSFIAVPNVTYQIAVDGYNGASGAIQLNITMP